MKLLSQFPLTSLLFQRAMFLVTALRVIISVLIGIVLAIVPQILNGVNN